MWLYKSRFILMSSLEFLPTSQDLQRQIHRGDSLRPRGYRGGSELLLGGAWNAGAGDWLGQNTVTSQHFLSWGTSSLCTALGHTILPERRQTAAHKQAADKGTACSCDYCTHRSRLGCEPGSVPSHRYRHPVGAH